MNVKKNLTSEFRVTFEARKGNNVALLSATVKAETEIVAIEIAETKVKSMSPSYRDYDLTLKDIKQK